MSVDIGKIQFHYFFFEEKEVSDKMKNLEDTFLLKKVDCFFQDACNQYINDINHVLCFSNPVS